MVNIAIITLIGRNYGNRLQNYALNTKLSAMGCDARTVCLAEPHLGWVKLAVKAVLALVMPRFRQELRTRFRKWTDRKAWEDFDRLITWEPMPVERRAEELVRKYDMFITGSDQVWNWHFSAADREFLSFAPSEKKASYAASLGVDSLPPEQQKRYAENLKDFRFLSVREYAGSAIVEQLTGKPAPVHLDPAMLLSAEDWRRVMKRPGAYPEGKYVFQYFLGERNPAYEKFIEDFAREKGCAVMDINKPGNETMKGVGPAEFIALVNGCSYVFTDSFHGTVFSILFHKPFIIFDREGCSGTGNMSSRMDTLLRHFALGDRVVRHAGELKHLCWDIDYSRVDSILAEKRREAEAFLTEIVRAGI